MEAAMWMWFWIIVVVVAAVAAAKLIDRGRGSRGASRADDLPGTSSGRPKRIDTPGGDVGM
jgi:hypothetical protein